ncbi:MAG TPA: GNAT family N-acetyltransferase [Acidimicrobiales bacterium]|nr:GNAT family N-acetyltransferase [Acidimicrobiales bacterium]
MRLRTIDPSELADTSRLNAFVFGSTYEPVEGALRDALADPDRTWVLDADEPDAAFPYLATGAAIPMRIAVPGGADVDAHGVRGIAVLPTHRRRGILRAIMRLALDDAHERGDVLSCLWPTGSAIYDRYGYGIATRRHRLEVDLSHAALRPETHALADGASVRLVSSADAATLLAPVYEAQRAIVPAMIERDDRWWKRRLHDPSGTMGIAVATGPGPGGDVEGYAISTIERSWGATGPDNTVEVVEVAWTSSAAWAALWRYLTTIDLATKLTAWGRPTDEPLAHAFVEPRHARRSLGEAAWFRLVDVAAALTARSYLTEGRVVLEVRDPFCAWNEGRWALEAGPDGSTCKRTDEAADLTVSTSDLATAYFGAAALRDVAAVGRVDEHRFGAIDRLDALLAWPVAPWSVTWF